MVAISAHLQLAFNWIGFLNTLNYTGMASVMSDKFLFIERPESLGLPRRNGTEYLEAFRVVPIKYFNISLPTPENIVEQPDAVRFYTFADGQSTHGFPFKNEYAFLFTFEDDKLLGIDQFMDVNIVTAMFNNETIAAQAELDCQNR